MSEPESDQFFEYFKDNYRSDELPQNSEQNDDNSVPNKLLNAEITDGEILKAIKALGAAKAAALDGVLNEYIKASASILLPIYVKPFNLVLKRRLLPDMWLQSVIIIPIYKTGSPRN